MSERRSAPLRAARGAAHAIAARPANCRCCAAPTSRCTPARSSPSSAPSGTGKSTLLHLAGLLEQPDGGSVYVQGREAGALSDAERTAIRRDTIGFVYQFHHLLAEFSALENVALPQMIARQEPRGGAGAGDARCSRLSGSRRARRTCRASSRAASSSASRSRARWPTRRRCCSPTSRPATSTSAPRRWCSTNCWRRCAGRAWRR